MNVKDRIGKSTESSILFIWDLLTTIKTKNNEAYPVRLNFCSLAHGKPEQQMCTAGKTSLNALSPMGKFWLMPSLSVFE